ncbi:MAG: hypothetical protein ACC608_07845 [Anaerofustis sp.]
MENKKIFKIKISGDSSKIQIQQDTINSQQIQKENNNFDYEKVNKLIQEIMQYKNQFNNIYIDNADKVSQILDMAQEEIINRENPSKIIKYLDIIKNLTIGMTGSLAASGILEIFKYFGM